MSQWNTVGEIISFYVFNLRGETEKKPVLQSIYIIPHLFPKECNTVGLLCTFSFDMKSLHFQDKNAAKIPVALKSQVCSLACMSLIFIVLRHQRDYGSKLFGMMRLSMCNVLICYGTMNTLAHYTKSPFPLKL